MIMTPIEAQLLNDVRQLQREVARLKRAVMNTSRRASDEIIMDEIQEEGRYVPDPMLYPDPLPGRDTGRGPSPLSSDPQLGRDTWKPPWPFT